MICKNAIITILLTTTVVLSGNAQAEGARGAATLSTPPLLVSFEDRALCIAANVSDRPIDVTIEVIDLVNGKIADCGEDQDCSGRVTVEPNRHRNVSATSPGGFVYLCKFTVNRPDRNALRASICAIESKGGSCRSALGAE
jgi:hypothetical protein